MRIGSASPSNPRTRSVGRATSLTGRTYGLTLQGGCWFLRGTLPGRVYHFVAPEHRRLLDGADGGDEEPGPEPADGSARTVSQLATVSEVGQAVQTNTNLSSLLAAPSLS